MSKQNTRATIDANIKQNGQQLITGQILNSVLNTMVTDYAEQEILTELLREVGDNSTKIEGVKSASGQLANAANVFHDLIPAVLSAGTKVKLRLTLGRTASYGVKFRGIKTDGTVYKFDDATMQIVDTDYEYILTENLTHVGFYGGARADESTFTMWLKCGIGLILDEVEDNANAKATRIIDKDSELIGAGYYNNELKSVGQIIDDTIYNSTTSNHLSLVVNKGEVVDITTRFSAASYGEYVITNNAGRILKKGTSNGVAISENITENGRLYVNVNSNASSMSLLRIIVKSSVSSLGNGLQGLNDWIDDAIFHEEDKVIILDTASANNYTKLFKGDFVKGQEIEIAINSTAETFLNQLTFRYIKKGATSSTIINLIPVLNRKYRIVLPEDADYVGFWSMAANVYVGDAHCVLRYGLKTNTDHTADIVKGVVNRTKHIRFAMFTDTHFANLSGSADNVYDGVNELQRMQLLVDGINKVNRENPIDFVLSCGDTIINTESALQPFVEKVSSKFPAPFVSVHGNHDRCSDTIWSQYLCHPKEFSFEVNGFYFIFLDTWKGAWNESAGSLTYTEPNMTFLKSELDKAKALGCTPIVALHNVVDRTNFKAFLQKNGCNILLVGHQHFFENVIDPNTNETNSVNIMCAGWFAKRTNNYMVSPIVFNTAWGFDVIELKDGDIIRTHYIVPNNYMDSVPTRQEGSSFVPTGEPPLGVVAESSTTYHVWDDCVKDSFTPTFNFGSLIKK